ncbi:MAG: hypothetical protein J6Z22_03605 [Lachnospiraceae bacterium]|nr:hypothetical protein [Lachnospiraceae bacterium]
MENKNKKIFSTILLVVGVLFIIVSGGIFVSRTWQYLPEIVKKFCLIAVTGGFFLGSHFAKENDLRKTGMALYYLGVCFTGFSVMSILSALSMDEEWKRALTLFAMAVPVGIQFYRERKPVDLVIEIFLCDGMLLTMSGLGNYQYGSKVATLCFSTFTMALAALIYYCRKAGADFIVRKGENEEERDNRIMLVVGCVAYALHIQGCLPCTLLYVVSQKSFFFSLLPVLMLAASATVLWIAFDKHVIFRLVQSFFLAYAAFGTSIFFLKDGVGRIFFVGTALILIMMAALDRIELLVAGAALTVFGTFAQGIMYAVEGFRNGVDTTCYPYGICMAIALVVWNYFTKMDLRREQLIKFAAVFAAMNVNMIFASASHTYALNYAIAFFVAMGWLMIAFFVETFTDVEVIEKCFQTLAMIFALIPLMITPIISPVFYAADGITVMADFSMEYRIIFMGLGIVLSGIIWYDRFEEIRVVQLIGTGILMLVMIVGNLANPALPNVLFLGIAALAMLIIATFLKQKGYAIIAAVTLILVALYLTRELWMSIAWWVYLFVAGVGLVIYAIKKEKAEK